MFSIYTATTHLNVTDLNRFYVLFQINYTDTYYAIKCLPSSSTDDLLTILQFQ